MLSIVKIPPKHDILCLHYSDTFWLVLHWRVPPMPHLKTQIHSSTHQITTYTKVKRRWQSKQQHYPTFSSSCSSLLLLLHKAPLIHSPNLNIPFGLTSMPMGCTTSKCFTTCEQDGEADIEPTSRLLSNFQTAVTKIVDLEELPNGYLNRLGQVYTTYSAIS